MKKQHFTITLAILFLCQFTFAQLTVLSGPEYGSYHRFIEDINNVLKSDTSNAVINKSSSGAANNFRQIVDPESPYKLAMMQSDYLYHMKAKDAQDNTQITDDLFVLLPIASEEIHFVTRESKEYTGLKSLAKKRVAIGNKGQGTYVTANIIKDRSEVYWSSRNFHFDQALKELYDDYIDAFIIVGSAPIEMIDLNPEAFVDELALLELEDFNDWAKYYEPMTISKDTYKWLDKDINTFGVRGVLIVNKAKLDAEDIEELNKLVNGIKSSFSELIEIGHPKWNEVDFNNWTNSDWPLYYE